MPECPRFDIVRVVKALKRTLQIYTYGIISFLVLDMTVFYLYKINTDLLWRLKITIIGGIFSILWLISWWLVIKWVERR